MEVKTINKLESKLQQLVEDTSQWRYVDEEAISFLDIQYITIENHRYLLNLPEDINIQVLCTNSSTQTIGNIKLSQLELNSRVMHILKVYDKYIFYLN